MTVLPVTVPAAGSPNRVVSLGGALRRLQERRRLRRSVRDFLACR